MFGYYDGDKLMYAARTRNGFTLALRADLIKKLEATADQRVSVRKLTGEKSRTLGRGTNSQKMVDCQWLNPLLVGQFEFVEWTQDAHLRHARFLGLKGDQKAPDVRRE